MAVISTCGIARVPVQWSLLSRAAGLHAIFAARGG
jgi:hypothetical protein